MEIARNHYSGFIKKSGVFRIMKDTKVVPFRKCSKIEGFQKPQRIKWKFFYNNYNNQKVNFPL